VTNSEFFRQVRSALRIPEQSIIDDVVESYRFIPGEDLLGDWLRRESAMQLRRVMAIHLKYCAAQGPLGHDECVVCEILAVPDDGIDLEQLSLLTSDTPALDAAVAKSK
jgi:hypothetical protein